MATLRQPEAISDLTKQYPTDKLLVLQVDVSNDKDVIVAFAKIKEVYGRVDVVFNNAGTTSMGEFEGISDEAAKVVFDVNFWGAVRVTREAIKFFREVNPPGVGGRLIQNSSILGIRGGPLASFYSATKHGEHLSWAFTGEFAYIFFIVIQPLRLLARA